MKHAYRRFSPIVAVNGFENEVMIVHERRNIVLPLGADAVPAVVSDVVDE